MSTGTRAPLAPLAPLAQQTKGRGPIMLTGTRATLAQQTKEKRPDHVHRHARTTRATDKGKKARP